MLVKELFFGLVSSSAVVASIIQGLVITKGHGVQHLHYYLLANGITIQRKSDSYNSIFWQPNNGWMQPNGSLMFSENESGEESMSVLIGAYVRDSPTPLVFRFKNGEVAPVIIPPKTESLFLGRSQPQALRKGELLIVYIPPIIEPRAIPSQSLLQMLQESHNAGGSVKDAISTDSFRKELGDATLLWMKYDS